ncbi:MAG: hypothetical protein EB084_24620 [Proteobacteria bacterium]|nr:hypothetical protein [Pseudomonadota bacterium]
MLKQRLLGPVAVLPKRPAVLDMTRTTTIIGELIQLITELEDLTTSLGKEGYSYYKAGLFYDDITLDTCRRVEGALQSYDKGQRELSDGLDDSLFLKDEEPGPFTKLRKMFTGQLLRRELGAYERTLNEAYAELASRIRGVANTDPRSLSAKMLRICSTIKRLESEVDHRWEELEVRTKNERKGPMFILVLNMFVINFFKFSNQQWFRHWIAHLKAFQEKVGDRIHREVEHDLSVEDEAAETTNRQRRTAPRPSSAGPGRGVPGERSVDLGGDGDDDEASTPAAPTSARPPAVTSWRDRVSPASAPAEPPAQSRTPASFDLGGSDDDEAPSRRAPEPARPVPPPPPKIERPREDTRALPPLPKAPPRLSLGGDTPPVNSPPSRPPSGPVSRPQNDAPITPADSPNLRPQIISRPPRRIEPPPRRTEAPPPRRPRGFEEESDRSDT